MGMTDLLDKMLGFDEAGRKKKAQIGAAIAAAEEDIKNKPPVVPPPPTEIEKGAQAIKDAGAVELDKDGIPIRKKRK